ncbi:MAG: transposase, partial [Acidobacteriota bacterium]
MGYPLRYVPEGGALVEVTINTIQGRYLLRPDARGRVNELILGVIGRAQELYSISIVAVAALSSHMHLLLVPETAKQLADFMRHMNTNLSREIGRLHNWPGKLLERRYRAILVSDEPEDQIARLRYLLAAGVKEQLVERAINWPGVHSARALTRDHPLRGWWFDRSREYAEKRRGKHFGRYEHATEMTVQLDPLPSWRHLKISEVRRRCRDLLREIQGEAAVERRFTEKEVLGPEAAMTYDPHHRPENLERSPAPPFHARGRVVRKAMRDAYAWVVTEYREAAERLRGGDPLAKFPEGTFPPSLPFV